MLAIIHTAATTNVPRTLLPQVIAAGAVGVDVEEAEGEEGTEMVQTAPLTLMLPSPMSCTDLTVIMDLCTALPVVQELSLGELVKNTAATERLPAIHMAPRH